MKKTYCSINLTITLLISIIILATGCKQTDKNFSLNHIDNITSIELSQDSLTVTLAKSNDLWLVNNEYEVGEEQLDMLLYIINTQHVELQIPDSETPYAAKTLAENGIQIKVYEKNKLVLDIIVASNDSLGYFGRAENNKQLYRIALPDIIDNPISFLSANPSFWKHNVILAALPSEIESVLVDNMENPEQSFRITRKHDGSLSLMDLYNTKEISNVNQEKLNVYLSYFTGLSYEQMLDIEPEDQLAILLSDSPYKLTICTKDSEVIELQLFYIADDDGLDSYGNALEYDTNQFYLSMNDGRDIALAKWVNFDLLLRDLAYFVEN